MKTILDCLCLGLAFLLAAQSEGAGQADSLPCFPGAEGFGITTPGGRGGRVIKVTNLNPGGPGSLQQACSTPGPRIVVFDVSGVIPADVRIDYGQITIAGQTAPGAGITIRGMLHTNYNLGQLEDIVVRFLRVRPNPSTGTSGDAIQFSRVKRCVLDHVSCSWASDETVDIFSAKELTLQWCAIEESDIQGHPEGQHNYGLINGPEGEKVSIHHTLFAHHRRRCPALANGPSDVRNNVVYDFRDGFCHDNQANTKGFNIIGNYYKRGPSEPDIFPFCFASGIPYYLRDNYIHGLGLIQDPWAEAAKLHGLQYYAGKGVKAPQEFEVPPVTTHSPLEAFDLVLDLAGCFPRDSVSRRTVREVSEGTGSWGRHAPAELMAGLTPQAPPRDTDSDGMPDSWEQARGLDPADSLDHNQVLDSGYTAIEEYCNTMAAKLIETRGLESRRGDLDQNGKTDIFDLLDLLRAMRSATVTWAADLNQDGRVNVFDLLDFLGTVLRSGNPVT